ncbi:MAG: pyridoxal-phosphate dependent enzyme [Actinomycetota bacterium]|nr:pyridoxal-phosphate dependent enzyme [Actinomycetota bacterium]
MRTPLVRLHAPEIEAEIYLKLENLQPIGSFKIRGATNAIRRAPPEELDGGVVTASAGNMAQGVAWAARELGVPATIVAPEHIPATKRAAVERLGGKIVAVPVERWFRAIEESRYDGVDGFFVHPVQDDAVMAGNGTIGLEVLEDLPDPDVVLIPWGGGGLTVGIASAIKALRPVTRILPVEPETAAPLAASLAAGQAREVDYRPSFVDGAGARMLLAPVWTLARPLIDGSETASLDEAAAAVRFLAERARVVAEGAGALSTAVALSGRAGAGKIVCIVSGGNIDAEKLAAILRGRTP